MPVRSIHRNITTDPPPARPAPPLCQSAPVPSQESPWSDQIRHYLTRMMLGLRVGTTVGALTRPLLGAASGALFFPGLFVLVLIQSLFTGSWSDWDANWGELAGFVFLPFIAAVYGAVIGLIPGIVMGALIGVVAALLSGRRRRAPIGALLGAALSVLLFGLLPPAGVLFVLSGAIGGWRVAIAVDRKLQCLSTGSP